MKCPKCGETKNISVYWTEQAICRHCGHMWDVKIVGYKMGIFKPTYEETVQIDVWNEKKFGRYMRLALEKSDFVL